MTKVFIDGSAGTTGLRIRERLAARQDLVLLELSDALRKDPEARKDALNGADIAFLCLPDDAARESASLVSSGSTVLIDTSTAHRTDPAWTYGFPELRGQREKLRKSLRIANPGCHASGFISLIAPLVAEKALCPDVSLSCTSLTGYSGGGKKMIAEYEGADRNPLLDAPRLYGLSQVHKHLPEMVAVCGLSQAPVFCPVVAPYYAGMEVIVPLHATQLNVEGSRLTEIYAEYYRNEKLIRVVPSGGETGFLSASALAGRDILQISVEGSGERLTLIARFDNLGKGASGAAIQNMNLALGVPEDTGLVI